MTKLKASDTIPVREKSPALQIILFVIPLIATSILQLLFNTADAVIVGRWGGSTPEECEAALGAVGSCGSLINMIITVFMGLAVGAGVCVARFYGAKNQQALDRTVHTAVPTALLCSLAVAFIGEFFARDLLILMETPEAILDQATLYMRAYFAGIPANMLYNFCASMLRSTGDTTRPLIFLSTGGVINVILNIVSVVGFGLGALGVGIATAVSQWVSCLLILLFMMRTSGPCHLILRRLRIDVPILKQILVIGIPSGIQGFVFSFSNVMVQASINSFGDTAINAGNTAGANISDYVYFSQNAFYHAALTYVGQSVGAKRIDKIRSYVLWCICFATVIGLSLGLFVYAFSEPLLSIFSPGNAAAIACGKIRLAFIAIPYFLCGVMEIGSGALRAIGKSFSSMVIAIIGSCALRVVWILTVFAAFHTLEVLYSIYPISWFVTACAYYILLFFEKKKLSAKAALPDA